jgi:hypothetical protein
MFINGLKNNPPWHIQKSPAVRNVSGFNSKRNQLSRLEIAPNISQNTGITITTVNRRKKGGIFGKIKK